MRRAFKIILIVIAIILIVPAPLIWLPDLVLRENIITQHQFSNGRTIQVYEILTSDFYRRELRDFAPDQDTYKVVVLDPDPPKAWLCRLLIRPSLEKVDLHFLKYKGTYNLVKSEFTSENGVVFSASSVKKIKIHSSKTTNRR